MVNAKDIRSEFEHIKNGIIYFNHAAMGPLHNSAAKIITGFVDSGKLGYENYIEEYMNSATSAKKYLAKLLNVSPGNLSSSVNVSSALNLLVNGLKWNRGNRIIINDIEFPSNVYPFMNLRKYGVETDFVKTNNGKYSIDDYERLITPETKLISVSLVQFLSGYKADLSEFSALCKAKDILLCVDGIQGAGAVEIDLKKTPVDFFCGGSHKWFMGLTGASYFYVSDRLLHSLEQTGAGWLSVKDEWELTDYNLTFKEDASRFETGTMNSLGEIVFSENLKIFTEYGLTNIYTDVLNNTKYFIERLKEEGFEPLLADAAEKNLSGIVTIKNPGEKDILEKLWQRKISAAMREGLFRISPHFYNNRDEIEYCIKELKTIAGY